MARVNAVVQTFNRGRISKLALARTDLDRTRQSAEIQTNWVPRALGSMMLRPGFGYIGPINNSSTARIIGVTYASTFTALIELTSGTMQIWSGDQKLTRAGSTAVVTNGDFSSTLTGWTDADQSGSTSFLSTDNYLALVGSRYARAQRRQTITSSSGTHGVALTIERGRVVFRAGSSAGGDDYFAEVTLRPGAYSFAITSTGNFDIEIAANTEYASLVSSVSIESSGNIALATPWPSADLGLLRWDQSADVLFVAAEGYQQRRLERYSSASWGVALYEPEDGPFRGPNVTNKRLTASGLAGDITLTCDQPLFTADHVGALFRHTSLGQNVSATITGGNQFSSPIRVTGVGTDRKFNFVIDNPSTFSGTVRLQRSVGSSDTFSAVSGQKWTSTISSTYQDTFDNQIIFYRLGVQSTEYTSGSIDVSMSYQGGGIVGVARITSVTAATAASASVLTALGSTDPTELWEEGSWSAERGFPSAIVFHEGRLWFAGRAYVWGSISDAYESFDPAYEGDAGPINRTIAKGGVSRVPWLASLGRLIVGTETREMQAKTGSLDEPLTPDNYNLRDVSSQGSANVTPVTVDNRVIFIQRNGTRILEIDYSAASLDYQTIDLSALIPEIGEPSIARLGIQRQPDTRLHCVRSATDGTVALVVTEPTENVAAWIDIETSGGVAGAIEDVAVLPGTIEDSVYYIVRREINGATMRFLEKWGQESQARGGSSNRLADSHVVYDGTAISVISATHLIGSSVVIWGSSADLGSATVDSTGGVSLATASTYACVGLPYSGLYKSMKLAYGAQAGTALTQRKRVSSLGLVMADIHAQALQYGPSTDTLDPLPLIEKGTMISTDAVNATYDEPAVEFEGQWDTDSRLVLLAQAPRPATVLAYVMTIDTKEEV